MVCYIFRKKVTQNKNKNIKNIKTIVMKETITILQANIEVQHIVYVI